MPTSSHTSVKLKMAPIRTNSKPPSVYDEYETAPDSVTDEQPPTGLFSKPPYKSSCNEDSIFGSSTTTGQTSISTSAGERIDNKLFTSCVSQPGESVYGIQDGGVSQCSSPPTGSSEEIMQVINPDRRAFYTSLSMRPQARSQTPDPTSSNSSPLLSTSHRRSPSQTPTPTGNSSKFLVHNIRNSEHISASFSPSPNIVAPSAQRPRDNVVGSWSPISLKGGESHFYHTPSKKTAPFQFGGEVNNFTGFTHGNRKTPQLQRQASHISSNSDTSSSTESFNPFAYNPHSFSRDTTPTPKLPELIKIQQLGDLEICAGSSKFDISMRFLVSYEILITSSPKFYQELASDSNSDTAIEIKKARLKFRSPTTIFMDNYADYHQKAWDLVFKILHDANSDLPRRLDFGILVDIASICEEYGLHEKLRNVGVDWCDQWKNNILEKGFENWIILAWAFGLEREFQIITRHLAITIHGHFEDGICEKRRQSSELFGGHTARSWASTPVFVLNDENRFLRVRGDGGSLIELSRGVPNELTLSIYENRERLLRPIRNMFQKTLRELRSPNVVRCKAQKEHAQQCDWINLGLISHAVCNKQLEDDETWRGGITEISNIISNIAKEFRDSKWKCKSPATLLNPDPLPGSAAKPGPKGPNIKNRIKTCAWAEELEYKLQKAIKKADKLDLCYFTSRMEIFPDL